MSSILRLLAGAALLLIAAQPVQAGEPVSVGGLVFQPPADWQQVAPSSRMRKAQFVVPNPGGRSGMAIFYFFGPGRGGTAEANIARWYGQFAEPRDELDAKIERQERDGRAVHLFRARGTYLSGMPGGPSRPVPDTALLGAVISAADANVFIRLVAPAELGWAQAEAFNAMALGARAP